MELDAKQKVAIERCTNKAERLVPITGAAGTGKTTIIKTAYDDFVKRGQEAIPDFIASDWIAVAAPTGKAAKRIKEATGIEATTIHRLLEYSNPGDPDPKTGKPTRFPFPRRHREKPLTQKILFIDEYAMVNQELHRNIMDALPSGAIVRVFGDRNQLPPIEQSAALANQPSAFTKLLQDFNGTVLETLHRQGSGSGIVKAGTKINNGNIPLRSDDFTMKLVDTILEALIEYIEQSAERGIDFNKAENQIIIPTKRGKTGTHGVNALLQSMYQEDDMGWYELERHPWELEKGLFVRVHQGDKVLWTHNDYNLNIFNGESGIITLCEPNEGILEIDFGDRTVCVPPLVIAETIDGSGNPIQIPYNPQRNIELGYAITTHKSQGSEYQNVIYMMNRSCGMLRSRKNFYTGITRARKVCHVISDQPSLSFSVNNNRDMSFKR